MTVVEMIELEFSLGWEGTADQWWAEHAFIKTINSIAPTFTKLKQEGLIVPAGERVRTRSGGLATPYRAAVRA